jgi:hypothetical protein
MRFRDEFQLQITYAAIAAYIVAFWWAFGSIALWVWS